MSTERRTWQSHLEATRPDGSTHHKLEGHTRTRCTVCGAVVVAIMQHVREKGTGSILVLLKPGTEGAHEQQG